MLETSNDNELFFIVDFVIALDKKHVFIKENHEMKNILIVFL